MQRLFKQIKEGFCSYHISVGKELKSLEKWGVFLIFWKNLWKSGFLIDFSFLIWKSLKKHETVMGITLKGLHSPSTNNTNRNGVSKQNTHTHIHTHTHTHTHPHTPNTEQKVGWPTFTYFHTNMKISDTASLFLPTSEPPPFFWKFQKGGVQLCLSFSS